jgi:hypothetical protein
MKPILLFVFILTNCALSAQITDDFSDGDFNLNPTWTGTDVDYTVNGSFQLQLNNTVAATSYLSLPHTLPDLDNREWHFWTRQAFSPSGGNFGRVYLTSFAADLTTDPDGYYLQFGEAGSNDAVRLFKVDGGVHTELLAGPLAQIATSFSIGIRVVRDNLGNWSLYIDDAGGTNYTLAGTVNDATALLGTHFGMLNTYTMSNSDKFYYDDIYVGDEILDLTPPVLLSATAISATQVDVQYDEPLDQVVAETSANYTIAGITVNTATLDGVDPSLVHLDVSAMTNGTTYNLSTDLIEDISNNASGVQNISFGYSLAEIPLPGDVIINEFLCDEDPSIGLAESEFVEIYNRSSKVFDLNGWKLGDLGSDGTVEPAWLLPGAYMTLCKTTHIDSFSIATGVTSFPNLNNAGDAIVLKSDLGVMLDSINYTQEWYHDPSKENGGYSIERVNPNDPCSDITNWTASVNILGGTPTAQNSVYDITPDTDLPDIEMISAFPPNQISVEFDEGMDSVSLVNAIITTTPSLTVQSVIALDTFTNTVNITFVENITPSIIYTLQLQNVSDCWMNTSNVSGTFVLPDIADSGDLLINEILFNPITGGTDWVEIYNNSDKVIDLYNWQLANDDNGFIGNNEIIQEHALIYPDDYAVFTEDSLHVLQTFPAVVPGNFVQMNLPSYNDDSSTVYLLQDNTLRDHLSYSDDWHFSLMDDDEGKSLERIDPELPTNSQSNWHTAAESIGFGTPGGENSQFYPAIYNGEFSYTSETISPDNDGFEDVLQVNHQMSEPGFLGTFTIYDDRGRKIKTVIDLELLSKDGSFTWNGINEDGNKASVGIYVGIFEAFNINGGLMFTKKKAFTVASVL